MAYQTLKVRRRGEETRGPGLKALRRRGRVPVVVSRAGHEPLLLTADTSELLSAAHKTGIGGIVMLIEEENDQQHLGLLKSLQWEPISKDVLNAGFQEVKTTQVVNTSVPIRFRGEPQAVIEKEGQLIKNTESVEVHARVTDLPSAIAVDVSGLKIGDVVTAADIVMPEGCTPVNPDTVVCSLTARKIEEEPVITEVEITEPELVGKAEAEEETEGG